jgi:hypothetical protein
MWTTTTKDRKRREKNYHITSCEKIWGWYRQPGACHVSKSTKKKEFHKTTMVLLKDLAAKLKGYLSTVRINIHSLSHYKIMLIVVLYVDI